jgi:UDP-GlcNAc:undecaprenyl-phosphate GlcNAc-1-phosphate transferase
MGTLGKYVIVLVAAAVVTCATVPLARIVAQRVGAVVPPGDRRVHTRPTPTLGGIAMFLGLLAGLGVAASLNGFSAIFDAPGDVLGVACAAGLIFFSGFVDDLREVSAPAKLAGMIVAGSALSLAGVTIVNVPIPFIGFTVLAPDLAVVVTVLWVVVMANAVNLIDGLDGLAAGIVGIAAAAFLVYGIKLERIGLLDKGNIGPLIAAVVVGICLGFLPWNFHPASIFMGDSGALTLGLLMAASTIAVGGQSDNSFTGQSWFFFAPLVLPLIILGVPLLDMVFAVLRRATRRQGLATADKDHLHHRLMRLGHGHRRSVLIMWGFTGLLSAFALVPVLTGAGTALGVVAAVGALLVLFTMLGPWMDRRRQNGRKATTIGRRADDAVDLASASGAGVDARPDDRPGQGVGGGAVDHDRVAVDPDTPNADRLGHEAGRPTG